MPVKLFYYAPGDMATIIIVASRSCTFCYILSNAQPSLLIHVFINYEILTKSLIECRIHHSQLTIHHSHFYPKPW